MGMFILTKTNIISHVHYVHLNMNNMQIIHYLDAKTKYYYVVIVYDNAKVVKYRTNSLKIKKRSKLKC